MASDRKLFDSIDAFTVYANQESYSEPVSRNGMNDISQSQRIFCRYFLKIGVHAIGDHMKTYRYPRAWQKSGLLVGRLHKQSLYLRDEKLFC